MAAPDHEREAQRRLRAEFALVAQTADKWIWVTDPEEAYVPAKILTEHADGSKEVEVNRTHEIKTLKKENLGPYIPRLAELKNHVDGACEVRGGDGRGEGREGRRGERETQG